MKETLQQKKNKNLKTLSQKQRNVLKNRVTIAEEATKIIAREKGVSLTIAKRAIKSIARKKGVDTIDMEMALIWMDTMRRIKKT